MKLQAFSTQVESSNIKELTIIPTEKLLIVEFNNGTKYLYTGVTSEVAGEVAGADSVGKAFNKLIKPNYDYHKV